MKMKEATDIEYWPHYQKKREVGFVEWESITVLPFEEK